ncbi:MAG: anhydro-N-acetylmuramic acid kinase [bacterium]
MKNQNKFKKNNIINKKEKKVIGLISGTSADGVDSAIVEIHGFGINTSISLIDFATYPYPNEILQRLFKLFASSTCRIEEICEMNFILGNFFAQSALNIIEKSGLRPHEIDLIGSHGQTICHLPDRVPRSTFQIAEPSVISNVTGIVTVADFRVADVAVGGNGAPLVPYVDYLLLGHKQKNRAIQNIGGISNVTFLPANCGDEDIIAFDTGPGNMIIDELARIITNGQKNYDINGEMASKGTINESLLNDMLSDPFIHRPPPKTAGRENFGSHFTQKLLEKATRLGISAYDIMATATAFTVESIYENYRISILKRYNLHEIIISGGGLHNLTLMNMLKQRFHPIPVKNIEEFGISSDAKEAIAFAILANETINGNPNNVPSATSATKKVILGKICIPFV